MKVKLYRSHCMWPVWISRLLDGYLIRFFWLTIIVETVPKSVSRET